MIDRTQIQRATRVGIKARLALAGPTGSGKTYSALGLATVFAEGKGILLVDTEHGEARTYADEFVFDEFVWEPPYDPRELIVFLKKNAAQYGCVVIDSTTHFYNGEGGLLNIVDASAARSGGNSYAGWRIATPIQNELIEALKGVPCHLIVTMRSKMEYVLQQNARGKQEPVKVGMAPIQREGFEYEMTFIAELDRDHNLMVSKTRYSGIADKVYRPLHQTELADALMAWLSTATPEAVAATVIKPPAQSSPPPNPTAAPGASLHGGAAGAAGELQVLGPAGQKLFPETVTTPVALSQPITQTASLEPGERPVTTADMANMPQPHVPNPASGGSSNTHWIESLKLLAKIPPEHTRRILQQFDLPPKVTSVMLRNLPDDKGLALLRTLELMVETPA